jgi:hypothetical protein
MLLALWGVGHIHALGQLQAILPNGKSYFVSTSDAAVMLATQREIVISNPAKLGKHSQDLNYHPSTMRTNREYTTGYFNGRFHTLVEAVNTERTSHFLTYRSTYALFFVPFAMPMHEHGQMPSHDPYFPDGTATEQQSGEAGVRDIYEKAGG